MTPIMFRPLPTLEFLELRNKLRNELIIQMARRRGDNELLRLKSMGAPTARFFRQ